MAPNVRCWHQPDQPGRSIDVRCSGQTGSGWQSVKPARLTQPGHLTAWTCAEKVLRLGSSASGVLAVKRREFITLIGVSAAWPAVAQAQRQPTLGLLGSSELADWAIKSFRTGLEEGG
jgi:hypothetical protein